MKITAIKQQERLKSRYSVYIDDKYSFSLSADALLAKGLHPNQEIDDAQLAAYKKLSADDKAYNLTLAYIARRMRSAYELQQYLRRKEYDQPLADTILERLTNLGLVDDVKFAEAWVRNRRLLKSVSKRRLEQELRAKRVADHIISTVLQADETDEHQVLHGLIARKRRQSRYQDDVKLMRYLLGQGFGYEAVKRAIAGQDNLGDDW